MKARFKQLFGPDSRLVAAGAHRPSQSATMLVSGNVALSPSSPCSRPRNGACCARLRVASVALLPFTARGGYAFAWAMGRGCLRRGLQTSDEYHQIWRF